MAAAPLASRAPRRTGFMLRLAGPMASAAVFLCLLPNIHAPGFFFTASDFLFCGVAILLLASGRLPMQPMGSMTPFWLSACGLILGGLFAGSVFYGDPVRWINVALQYAFTYVLLPFLLIGHDRSRALSLATVLVVAAVFVELAGIVAYYGFEGNYSDYQRIGFGHRFITGGRRLGSFIGNPNANGVVIAMSLPLVLYLWFNRKLSAPLALFCLGVLGTGLVLTSSVTGFMASGASLAIVLLLAGSMRLILRSVGAMAVCTAVLLATGYQPPDVFQKRVMTAFEAGDIEQAGTFKDRLEVMEEAWRMASETTLLGVGVDQFRQLSDEGAAVHNMYLILWVEGGLPALTGWLLLLLILGAATALAYPRDRMAAAVGLSVLSAFAIASVAAPHMYGRYWAVPLQIAMAFVFAALKRDARRPASREGAP
jgi:O-antigen ligase